MVLFLGYMKVMIFVSQHIKRLHDFIWLVSNSGTVLGDLGTFQYSNTYIVNARCPLDNTQLVVRYGEQDAGRGMKYDCAACRAVYSDLDRAKLAERAKQYANELYRLREEACKKIGDLDRILGAAEKRGIKPQFPQNP